VRAGHRDAVFHAHQLAQHLGAWNHRYVAPARRQHLGIVGLDCAGNHHHISALNLLGAMPDLDLPAQYLQPAGRLAGTLIRPGHTIAEVEQHLGYP